MMPELGKYGVVVGAAYGASIALILALVALSIWRAGVVKRALRDVEVRMEKQRG